MEQNRPSTCLLGKELPGLFAPCRQYRICHCNVGCKCRKSQIAHTLHHQAKPAQKKQTCEPKSSPGTDGRFEITSLLYLRRLSKDIHPPQFENTMKSDFVGLAKIEGDNKFCSTRVVPSQLGRDVFLKEQVFEIPSAATSDMYPPDFAPDMSINK